MIYNVLQVVSRMYKHTSVHIGVKALKLQRLQTINLSVCCRVLLKLRHWQIIVDKCQRCCLWTCPSVQHKAWTKFIGVRSNSQKITKEMQQTNKQRNKNNKRNKQAKKQTIYKRPSDLSKCPRHGVNKIYYLSPWGWSW